MSSRNEAGSNLTRSTLDALGRAIVTGRYDARPFPTEAEIAKAHGVSRSVTREAVKMLTAKGLVSARPRHGTKIEPVTKWNLFDPEVLRWTMERRPSTELLRHFNELRMAIEPEAAALAAINHEPADLEALRASLQRMGAAQGDHPDGPLEADIEFHVAVLRASKNPFFLQLRSMVSTALQSSIRLSNRLKGGLASVADHAAVADAIERRDPQAARSAMSAIIAEVLGLLGKGSAAER